MFKLFKMATLAGLLAITSIVQADAVTGSFTNGDKANVPEKSLEAWQLGLINNPDDYMLQREAKGFVFIYDRLLDSQVDEILDNHFNRIDSMMFTRVKVTDSRGDVQTDPETGEDLTEDDGCD